MVLSTYISNRCWQIGERSFSVKTELLLYNVQVWTLRSQSEVYQVWPNPLVHKYRTGGFKVMLTWTLYMFWREMDL